MLLIVVVFIVQNKKVKGKHVYLQINVPVHTHDTEVKFIISIYE